LPRTVATIRRVADRIAAVQDLLGRRILVENISSYVQYQADEMTEAEFVVAVAERADCDLLLDINNVVVNAYNHGFDARGYVQAMPARRVKQLHLAGHADRGSYLFDDHSGPVPPVVWSLYETALETFGDVPAIIEWDQDVPALPIVVAQVEHARALACSVGSSKAPRVA
jgi:uncharacterized protein (UPF0276 family)